MSKYTIDIYTLLKDESFKLFNFNYDFYTDDENVKNSFEQKFIDTFMFNELGFETVARFKHFLKTRLNNIMPYYSQLYITELKSKDIEFLLNKDLTETFTREVEGTVNNNSTSNASNTNNFKESSLENGNATLDLNEGQLTSISETKDSGQVDNNSTSNNNERETTTLVSRGNIGITSSAELLEKWREVLINIDTMIIEDCKDLFMMIY